MTRAAAIRIPSDSTAGDLAERSPVESRLQPLVVELLQTGATADGAEALCRQLVGAQYENFSVVSRLLPRPLRQDFCNIYAFCRTADDLGDELGDRADSLAQLDRLAEQTRSAFAGRPESNLFVALDRSVRRHQLPIEPFLDLISAFAQDQTVTRYESRDQVLDYCRRSANPVGRLVLLMCGYRDDRRAALSDDICTALQLINFWQDVRRDLLDRDRVYLPAESMRQFGVTEADVRRQIAAGRCEPGFIRLIGHELDFADAMMARGRALLPTLRRAVRGQVSLFAAGGSAISRAIRRQNFDTLARRPALSKAQKARLVASAMIAAAGVAAGDALSCMIGGRDRRPPGDAE